MADDNKIELRSEEVQEIMGTPPRWIVRWGITIILFVVVTLLVGSYFYKYPDLIPARVTILSENPPISVVARSDGRLDKLFVNDKETVDANTILGIIENPADHEDVLELTIVLDSIQTYFSEPGKFIDLNIQKEYSLGQFQSFYSSFLSQLNDFHTYLKYNPNDQKIASLNKQVEDYRNFYAKSREQIAVLRQDYELANSQYMRDSSLYAKNVASEVDLEKSKTAMLRQKFAYQNSMTNLASTQITMNQLEQQIKEQKLQKVESGNRLVATLKEKYDNLINQLKSWEQTYVLRTPIAGTVTFTNYWSVNQFVSPGNVVFTVVPDNEQEIIGKAIIPLVGAGKVEPEQKVNIKLDNYPYMEYGMLEGTIANISMVPVTTDQGGYYTAEIELRNKLITNYKIELPFNQEMQGGAEIITKDRRLIERLVEPLVSIFRERI